MGLEPTTSGAGNRYATIAPLGYDTQSKISFL